MTAKSTTPDSRKAASYDPLQDLQNEIFAEREDVRLAHERSRAKRAIAMALVGIRKIAGLTQTELAARAGWDKAFVSRLEGASGGLPQLETLVRYAGICGAPLRLVVGEINRENIIDLSRAAYGAAAIAEDEASAHAANTAQSYVSES
jgi:transcriptional regulator with XRE-family HTH domain